MKALKQALTTLLMTFFLVLIVSPVVKAEASSYVQQIDATENSATVSWSSPYSSRAEAYVVLLGDQVYGTPLAPTTNTLTITGLAQGQSYLVTVCILYGGDLYALNTKADTYTYVRTTPSKISYDSMDVLWDKKDNIMVDYVDINMIPYTDGMYEKYIDGIEFKVRDVKGKVKKTVKKTVQKTVYPITAEDLIDDFTFKAPSGVKNKGMQYQVRTYITLDNGKKVYSDWTSKKVMIPQAKITKSTKVGTNQLRYTWNKVSGAKSYTIYKTTNGGKKFKKVKTVSANTTTYTVSGVKANNKDHGVWIRADKVKVGKKKYNSTQSYYTYTTITYR